MKANKTHISLETAKLLKDCDLESEYYWHCPIKDKKLKCGHLIKSCHSEPFVSKNEALIWLHQCEKYNDIHKNKKRIGRGIRYCSEELYPAYTWQEILWDNNRDFLLDDDCNNILTLLQQKKYEEADKYFREHCILINNK